MPLQNFNVVVVGDGFPVPSLKLQDFKFRHREFQEVMRLPVLLAAETKSGVRLQVLEDRFEVFVAIVDDVAVQAAGLAEMFQTFEEYVGKRTLRQVGHNFSWKVTDSSQKRELALSSFVKRRAIDALFEETEIAGADVTFVTHEGAATRNTVRIGMTQLDDIVLDFNFHFELADLQMDARAAVGSFMESYALAVKVAKNFETMLGQTQAVEA